MHLHPVISYLKINYNSKGQAAPSEHLFYAVTEIEKDRYTLIEQSAYYVLFNMAVTNSTTYYYNMAVSII